MHPDPYFVMLYYCCLCYSVSVCFHSAAIAVCHLRGAQTELSELAGEHVSQLTELEQRLAAKRGCDEADRGDIARELATGEGVLRRLAVGDCEP